MCSSTAAISVWPKRMRTGLSKRAKCPRAYLPIWTLRSPAVRSIPSFLHPRQSKSPRGVGLSSPGIPWNTKAPVCLTVLLCSVSLTHLEGHTTFDINILPSPSPWSFGSPCHSWQQCALALAVPRFVPILSPPLFPYCTSTSQYKPGLAHTNAQRLASVRARRSLRAPCEPGPYVWAVCASGYRAGCTVIVTER
ncbi:hypothetical protein BCV69DRAFT_285804 [Microstroma glucosiphilum]|uniref:Uncharacterized protein n=1 Tax=Pseudomicrostroma glucosiphilum TaxID=1684307 RepID=A0A316TVY3_9BASI|nr:hypothetical protein BCV69DRAFT_285804 [Pseudomicrostroma glucosiphilum]PWN17689.1 hypothetical protein BCV69DRAFT_285804 [Pseudomicrostroma glucosiphilum]